MFQSPICKKPVDVATSRGWGSGSSTLEVDSCGGTEISKLCLGLHSCFALDKHDGLRNFGGEGDYMCLSKSTNSETMANERVRHLIFCGFMDGPLIYIYSTRFEVDMGLAFENISALELCELKEHVTEIPRFPNIMCPSYSLRKPKMLRVKLHKLKSSFSNTFPFCFLCICMWQTTSDLLSQEYEDESVEGPWIYLKGVSVTDFNNLEKLVDGIASTKTGKIMMLKEDWRSVRRRLCTLVNTCGPSK